MWVSVLHRQRFCPELMRDDFSEFSRHLVYERKSVHAVRARAGKIFALGVRYVRDPPAVAFQRSDFAK